MVGGYCSRQSDCITRVLFVYKIKAPGQAGGFSIVFGGTAPRPTPEGWAGGGKRVCLVVALRGDTHFFLLSG